MKIFSWKLTPGINIDTLNFWEILLWFLWSVIFFILILFLFVLASFSGKLLLYDAWAGSFRSIKLRGRQLGCVVCGDTPSINALQDYELFCGAKATDKVNNSFLINWFFKTFKGVLNLNYMQYRKVLKALIFS